MVGINRKIKMHRICCPKNERLLSNLFTRRRSKAGKMCIAVGAETSITVDNGNF